MCLSSHLSNIFLDIFISCLKVPSTFVKLVSVLHMQVVCVRHKQVFSGKTLVVFIFELFFLYGNK